VEGVGILGDTLPCDFDRINILFLFPCYCKNRLANEV